MTEREVPDDLMKVAREVAEDVATGSPSWRAGDGPAHIIGRALAAEREACAALIDCSCDNPLCDLKEAAAKIRETR